jgi:hypothetical protein
MSVETGDRHDRAYPISAPAPPPSDLTDPAWSRIRAPRGPGAHSRWAPVRRSTVARARRRHALHRPHRHPWRALPHDFTVTWSHRAPALHAREHLRTGPRSPTCSPPPTPRRPRKPGPTRAAPAPHVEAATKAGTDLEIVCVPKPIGGFVVQPRRWVVERTNGWINHHRRLGRQHETTLTAHEGILTHSQIGLLLRRLDKGHLFDTL